MDKGLGNSVVSARTVTHRSDVTTRWNSWTGILMLEESCAEALLMGEKHLDKAFMKKSME